MNPGLERYSEFDLEKVEDTDVLFDVADDVADLEFILPDNLSRSRLSEHLSDGVLAYIVDDRVGELIECLPPLMPRAGHRLHYEDPSREVDILTLDHEVREVLRCCTDGVEDAGEIACRVHMARNPPCQYRALQLPSNHLRSSISGRSWF